jgi:hypothetical protein
VEATAKHDTQNKASKEARRAKAVAAKAKQAAGEPLTPDETNLLEKHKAIDRMNELKAELVNGNPFPLCHHLRDRQTFMATTGASQDLVVENK